MIRLVVLCLVAALGWMIWWAVGKGTYEQGLAAWIKGQGAGASYSALETTGFPNRFDTTISNLSLADPVSGTGWQVPFVQLLSLSYKPHQVIAVIAPEHEITLPNQTVTARQSDARASLFLSPKASLPLDSARLVVSDLALASTANWTAAADVRLALSHDPAQTNTYRAGAEVLGLTLPEKLRALIDPAQTQPDTISRLHGDAWITLTAPLDRHALEKTPPAVQTIRLSDLSVDWGKVTLAFKGDLAIDATGQPSGRITVTADPWRTVYDLAFAAGMIVPDAQESILNALTLASRGKDSIEAPLTVGNGLISLGPLPLATIPRLGGS